MKNSFSKGLLVFSLFLVLTLTKIYGSETESLRSSQSATVKLALQTVASHAQNGLMTQEVFDYDGMGRERGLCDKRTVSATQAGTKSSPILPPVLPSSPTHYVFNFNFSAYDKATDAPLVVTLQSSRLRTGTITKVEGLDTLRTPKRIMVQVMHVVINDPHHIDSPFSQTEVRTFSYGRMSDNDIARKMQTLGLNIGGELVSFSWEPCGPYTPLTTGVTPDGRFHFLSEMGSLGPDPFLQSLGGRVFSLSFLVERRLG